MSESTTVRVKSETANELYNYKKRGESYDEVIHRLLQYYKEHQDEKQEDIYEEAVQHLLEFYKEHQDKS